MEITQVMALFIGVKVDRQPDCRLVRMCPIHSVKLMSRDVQVCAWGQFYCILTFKAQTRGAGEERDQLVLILVVCLFD